MDANGIPEKHIQEMERERYARIEAADDAADFEDRTGGLASENMTVWDEFYKSVVIGLLSDTSGLSQTEITSGVSWAGFMDTQLSQFAAGIADAMMVERNKRKQQ